MNKVLIEKEALFTQSVKLVVDLLNYIGISADPLPDSMKLPGLMLVLSEKEDCYYSVSSRGCSCPAKHWQPGKVCKHQRRHFPVANLKRQNTTDTLNQTVSESIKPEGKWPGGHNGPVEVI
jgi:hypothetical protein